MSHFLSIFISVIVILGIIGIAYLLFQQWRGTPQLKPGEEAKLMDHVWDDTLQEYDHPLPKWWTILFVLCLMFGVVYLILYPGLGNYKGLWAESWSSASQYEREKSKQDALSAPLYAKYRDLPVETLSKNPEAMEMAGRLFQTYCIQCHGSDARGSKGFPNLTDDDWLYGGTPEDIKKTLLQGRLGQMPAFGAAFGEEKVRDVAHYVMSLSGKVHSLERASRGEETFQALCSTCHGVNGKGNQALGAPNLTDNIWLYGGSERTIMETITNGRNNQMPAWKDFLGEDKVYLLTAYVWGLSKPTPEPGIQ
jgi:cytochrome c oxidase cbb3-type subunit 3